MKLEGSCHHRPCGSRSNPHSPILHALLLLDLPQDGKWRRLRHQSGWRLSHAQIDGREHLGIYRARLTDADGGTRVSEGRRHFCRLCGSALWLWDPSWPDLVHPFASAIDSDSAGAAGAYASDARFKGRLVEPHIQAGDRCFAEYPDESSRSGMSDWGLTAVALAVAD